MIRLLLLLALSLPLWAQRITIRAGNLVDPATGNVTRNQVIAVEDGKIISVGAQSSVPAGAVDLSNAWVLPGLMDAHVHLTFTVAPNETIEPVYLRESSGTRLLRGIRNARDLLEAGFTVIRDVGNSANYADTDMRRAIEQGWFPGPTVVNSGKIIAPFGGQSHGVPLEQGKFWRFEYLDADMPDQVRRAVRQNIYYGATVIKLVADNSPFVYSQEEIRAAVDEAHRAGLAVAVHVMGGEAARNAILGGADSIEHGFALDDDLLRLMKEKGVFLVGTDTPLPQLEAMGTVGGILPEPKETYRQILDRLKRAHKIGVKMVFGTDIVIDMPGKTRAGLMLEFLDTWLAAGIPPRDILKAMTTHPAELLRMKDSRGSLAAGYRADIVATPENPLAGIRALRKVSFVMKDGKIVKKP